MGDIIVLNIFVRCTIPSPPDPSSPARRSPPNRPASSKSSPPPTRTNATSSTSPTAPSSKAASQPNTSSLSCSPKPSRKCSANQKKHPSNSSHSPKPPPKHTSPSPRHSTTPTAPTKTNHSKKTVLPNSSNSSPPPALTFLHCSPSQPARPPSTEKWTTTNSNCSNAWASKNAANRLLYRRQLWGSAASALDANWAAVASATSTSPSNAPPAHYTRSK